MTEDVSVVKLANVIGVTQKKGEAYEAKVRADTDSITEYGLSQFYPLVKEAIAFPCRHRTQGNCPSCLDTKIKNYARWMAEKGWELTKLHGRRQMSESIKKLMG